MRRLLIALLVLAGLLLAVDRIGEYAAQRVLAAQIRDQLTLEQDPGVDVRGFPFLTQALGGDYSDVRVSLPDVDSGALQNITVDARLQGVKVPLSKVVSRDVDEVPVDRISGDLRIGYDELARASGIEGLTITREGESLRLAGSVRALGQTVDASAVGRVAVENSDIVITAGSAEVAGVPVPTPILEAAARLLSFRVSPSGLPLSLQITAVRTGDTELEVSAVSTDVVLRSSQLTSSVAPLLGRPRGVMPRGGPAMLTPSSARPGSEDVPVS